MHLTRGIDFLVQDIALAGTRIRVVIEQAVDAVERLGVLSAIVAEALGAALEADVAIIGQAFVSAGEDAPVVAKDAVDTGAAGDPVIAPAADDVIVIGVAECNVVTASEIDRVVSGLAMNFVTAADVDL